jgi:aspartyl-tRNA(Asn)/glutamyl-tRNA(Gln) amidotransferase subunit A
MNLDLGAARISDLAPRLRQKQVPPVDLTRSYLVRIARLNPLLNAYITVVEDGALAAARVAEEEIRQGRYRGPLHGIPVALKDNLTTCGVKTTAGSRILADWLPEYDATVVRRLGEAGAIILGKTNMHEWALGGTTINPFFGTTRNPWNSEYIAGGSSGGSAAAVAGDLCCASLGTDSAQSVRNPASMCGIVGLKPTYGRVSQYGTVAGTGAYSTNHTGVLTKSVEDCALVLQAIAGHDPKDPLSASHPVSNYSKNIGRPVKGLRVGILHGYFDAWITDEVNEKFARAIDVFKGLGMELEDVTTAHMDLIPAIKVCTSRVENAAAHQPHLRLHSEGYSRPTLFSYVSAMLTPATTYMQAQRARRMVCTEFDALLKRVRFVILPTLPFAAPTIEQCRAGWVEINGRQVKRQDERGGLDSLCCIPFNVTGLPAISVCCGFTNSGMPVGLQIAAAAFEEELLFQVAYAYEQRAQWFRIKPPLAN